MTSVVIDERFRGPPASANGGYACGLAAAAIDGPAEVTLRVPPPLGRPLELTHVEGAVVLRDGDVVVVEARPGAVAVGAPAPVSLDEAHAAAEGYPWRDRHPYPTCFVCGPQRAAGDGLAIFPGPVDGRQLYAAPWVPEAELAEAARGAVSDEFVWAALDCPSGIVTDLLGDHGLIVLGRLTADLRRPVQVGRPHVVQAWPIEREGRKLHTASALFTGDGELCAVARAVWIELRPK